MLADFSLDEKAFGLEAIFSIEHGGQYLAAAHTLKYMRKTLFVPNLSLHGYYESWKKGGQKTLIDLAEETIQKRLKDYEQPTLEPEASLLIDKYLRV
jgi:trimethylamine--corrinoid protein Co-methyltransferase